MSPEFTAAMRAADAALLAALIAGFVAIVGPIASYLTSMRQLKVSVRSENRRVWIETMRSETVELLVSLRLLAAAVQGRDLGLRELNEIELTERVLKSSTSVALHLNPREEDHKRLLSLVESYQGSLYAGTSDSTDTAVLHGKILSGARSILKAEWAKLKRGK